MRRKYIVTKPILHPDSHNYWSLYKTTIGEISDRPS